MVYTVFALIQPPGVLRPATICEEANSVGGGGFY